MGKGLINREQCNTAEEFSVQAHAAWAAITMESVNGMVGSYSTHLCAVLVLRGQCLNCHRSVTKDLRRDIQAPRGFSMHEKPRQNLSRYSLREAKRYSIPIKPTNPPDRWKKSRSRLAFQRLRLNRTRHFWCNL
jgi:hypothetical protein